MKNYLKIYIWTLLFVFINFYIYEYFESNWKYVGLTGYFLLGMIIMDWSMIAGGRK